MIHPFKTIPLRRALFDKNIHCFYFKVQKQFLKYPIWFCDQLPQFNNIEISLNSFKHLRARTLKFSM